MYLPSLNISWSILENETYVIDERDRKVYKLRGVSHLIWKFLLKGMSIQEICERISLQFNVGLEEVRLDCAKFVKVLFFREFILEVDGE